MSANPIPVNVSSAAARPAGRSLGLAAGAVLALALVASYAPNFWDLIKKWADDPNYSHGFLVAPIALAILWQRRADLDMSRVRPFWPGWVVVLLVLASRAWLFERNEQWLEAATIPIAAAALVLAFGGWYLLRWAAPGLAFLYFMLPLPPRINLLLAGPLQGLVTWGSTVVLQVFGMLIIAEGNVIIVGSDRLEVEKACNGLSMLLSFITLITAT